MNTQKEINSDTKLETKDECVQVVIDNGWNNYKVKQLQKKAVELKIYQYLHRDAGTYYAKLHQKLFLPQTSIMTIASGTLFISLSDKISDNGRYWVNVFVSFLTLIGSVLSVWVKFFNAEQLSNDHINASKNYSMIIDNIEDQLSMEKDEREPFVEYMNKIRKMVNQQKQQSLEIDQRFWDHYFQTVSRGDLIMLNQNILEEQVNLELNRINSRIYNTDEKDISLPKSLSKRKEKNKNKSKSKSNIIINNNSNDSTDLNESNNSNDIKINIDDLKKSESSTEENNKETIDTNTDDSDHDIDTENETTNETANKTTNEKQNFNTNNNDLNWNAIRKQLIYQLQRNI
jgi:hypothetical protein